MTKVSLKLVVIMLSFIIFFIYCGEEGPTSSEAVGKVSVDIKESPIVFTWNEGIEKWETVFTIVFTESGGVMVDIGAVRSEALENSDIRDSFQISWNHEVTLPANGTLEYEWDFEVIGEDIFNSIKLIVFFKDKNGNSGRLEENFTELSFVE